jgi:hypothetical protein
MNIPNVYSMKKCEHVRTDIFHHHCVAHDLEVAIFLPPCCWAYHSMFGLGWGLQNTHLSNTIAWSLEKRLCVLKAISYPLVLISPTMSVPSKAM